MIDFNALDGNGPIRGQQHGEILAKIHKVLFEREAPHAVEFMQALMHARDGGDAAGRCGQLRSGFRIRRLAALQRKQADDQLQIVQQSVIGLSARQLLLADDLILLTKEILVMGDFLAQRDSHLAKLAELALVACGGARPLASNYGAQRRVGAGWGLVDAHGVSALSAKQAPGARFRTP